MPNDYLESDKELIEAYKKISQKYLQVKQKPWKDFHTYFSRVLKDISLPSRGIIVDIGAGNSRNLLVFNDKDLQFIALDFSFELLQASVKLENKTLLKVNNDMKTLSLRNNFADLILSIASLHHLRSKKETIQSLNHMYSILKDDGFIILSCWRKWKPGTRKKILLDFFFYPIKKLRNKTWRHGDISLPWYNESKNLLASRYYHLFTKSELHSILRKTNFTIVDFSILGGKGEKDNFFVLLKKTCVI